MLMGTPIFMDDVKNTDPTVESNLETNQNYKLGLHNTILGGI